MRQAIVIIGFLLFLPAGIAFGADDTDIPIQAPCDAVMAASAEVRAMADWADSAMLDADRGQANRAVTLEVRRQDHNVLRLGQSCMETPIRVGNQQFKHGLGTHANSEIAVAIPAGVKAFQARVGVDNNYDTEGKRGTVAFAVQVAGKEVFRTPVVKGGEPPVPIDVPLPPGTRQLVLKVDATPDGTAYDQADWADSRLILDDGRTLWLD